jgi:hypothetical protein
MHLNKVQIVGFLEASFMGQHSASNSVVPTIVPYEAVGRISLLFGIKRNININFFKNLSDIRVYPQSQLRNLIDVIISLCITTCFGPYAPSSGEYNYTIFKTSLRKPSLSQFLSQSHYTLCNSIGSSVDCMELASTGDE